MELVTFSRSCFFEMFTISVPKADDYFPVMRYKCSNDLRPVPIVSTFVTL